MAHSTGLYALGSNGSGQLGIGHQQDVSTPTKVLMPVEDDFGRPSRISTGGNHTLVLYPSGAVFASGENGNSRCGTVRGKMSSTFQRVFIHTGDQRLDSFKLCSATWEASTFVTLDNQVYTMGTGHKGELGQGYNVIHSSQPQRISNFPPPELDIVDLASSIGHTVAVLSNGEVYGWGAGRNGQLGEPASATWQPRLIPSPGFAVTRAVCGREFTYLVGNFREGHHTILGSDKWNLKSAAPKNVPEWRDIGAGWGSIFILLSTGVLMSWGRNDYGQLAPPNLPSLDGVAIGSEHAIGESKDGRILAWGWGEHGNCGLKAAFVKDSQEHWNVLSSVGCSDNLFVAGAGCATSWLWIRSANTRC